MVYEWRPGAVKYPVSADVAAEELHRIEGKNGAVTAVAVLDESRSKKAVLHECFEWDDTVAGEQWRLKQSRDLIGSIVKVSVVDDCGNTGKTKSVSVREFVNSIDTYENGRGTPGRFVCVDTAMANADTREVVIRNALRELIAFRKKYSMLQEFGKIFGAIDDVTEDFKQEVAGCQKENG